MYPENDYRDYLEHSAKGQSWPKHKYLYITPNGRYVYPKRKSKPREDYWLWEKSDIVDDTYVNAGRQGRSRQRRYAIKDYFIPDPSQPDLVAVSYKRGYIKGHKPGESRENSSTYSPHRKQPIKRAKKNSYETGQYSFKAAKKRSKQNRLIGRALSKRIG